MSETKNVRYNFCPVCGTAYQPDQLDTTSHICRKCNFVLYENQNATSSAIIIKNGQLLLVKRAHKPRVGYWDFPGGFIEMDETPQQAVIREVREELGVTIAINKLFNVYGPTEYKFQGKFHANCDIYFLAGINDDEIVLDDEISEYKWFSLDNLPRDDQLAFKVQIQLLADLKNDAELNKL